MIDSDIITYPEPPGFCLCNSNYSKSRIKISKPPAEEVYIIPIKNSSETPSDDDEDNSPKNKKKQKMTMLMKNTQVDEQQEDD